MTLTYQGKTVSVPDETLTDEGRAMIENFIGYWEAKMYVEGFKHIIYPHNWPPRLQKHFQSVGECIEYLRNEPNEYPNELVNCLTMMYGSHKYGAQTAHYITCADGDTLEISRDFPEDYPKDYTDDYDEP